MGSNCVWFPSSRRLGLNPRWVSVPSGFRPEASKEDCVPGEGSLCQALHEPHPSWVLASQPTSYQRIPLASSLHCCLSHPSSAWDSSHLSSFQPLPLSSPLQGTGAQTTICCSDSACHGQGHRRLPFACTQGECIVLLVGLGSVNFVQYLGFFLSSIYFMGLARTGYRINCGFL